MERNATMFRRIAEQIRNEPDSHDQDAWCGTQKCVAGWAMTFEAIDHLVGLGIPKPSPDEIDNTICGIVTHNYAIAGGDILGLDADETDILFYAEEPYELTWPEALDKIADGEDIESLFIPSHNY